MTSEEKQTRGLRLWINRVTSNTILAFVLLFARLDMRGVRHHARKRLKEILGAQFGEFRKSTKSHLIKKYLTATWTWSLIVPGFLGVFLFFTARVPEEYRLSKDILSQTLAIFLPVPLALVGLVIPFLALAVSVVYSRMGSGAVAYAMKRNRVIRIVYSALFVLGVLILIQLFTKICDALLGSDMAMDVISSIGWVVVILSTWWIIFLLILAGIGVASVLAAFSPAKALNAISKEMVTESMRTLEREFEENISLKVLEDELKDSHFEVGFFQPSDGRLITSKKIGNIANISIWGLLKINASLTPIQKAFLKIIFARPHHYIATHDSQIAGIRGDLSDSISETLFIRAVRSCFKIRKPKAEKDKLYQTLEHYNEITNTFLKGDNEDLVRVALDGYGTVLRRYMGLGLKLSAQDSPGFLGDWRPIMLIMDALTNCVSIAVRTSESKNIGMVAHWIKVLMQECIERHEEYLFSRLLNLYRSMHFYASKSKNVVGIHRSHFEPMQLLDYDIFRFGKTETVPSEKIAFRCRLASLIVQHLARLLRDNLDANNPMAVEEMLLHLQPEELYGHFHPDLPFDCFEVQRRLRFEQLSDRERLLLNDQQKSCQILEDFKKESRQWYVDILHNSLMYLVDKISYKAVKLTAIEQVVKKIWSRFPNWASTIDWLERHNVGRQIFDERLWEFWPESRRGQSKNPMAAPILVFTIRALFLQSQTSLPLEIPGLRTIDGFHNQILEVARSIQSGSDWRELTGIVSVDTLNLFTQALASAKQKYNDDVAESVKQAGLSEERITEFRRKVLASFQESSVLSHVVSLSTIDSLADYKPQEPQTISIQQNRYPKEAFIDQDRISYFGLGENEGRALGQGIDEQIWKAINAVLPAQKKIAVEQDSIASLDNAISQYDKSSRSSLVMVFSGSSEMRFNLWSAVKFTPAMQLGREKQKGFYGEYNGVPVYTAFNSAIDGVMLFVREDATFVDIQEPVVEVREFTEEERQNLTQRANVTVEKLREEVFVSIHITYKLAVSNNCESIVLSLGNEKISDL